MSARIVGAAMTTDALVAGGVADTDDDDSGDVVDIPSEVSAGVEVQGSGNPSGSVTDTNGDATPLGPSSTLIWILDRVTLDDGGTASGVFVFNASTQTATNWDITTTAGTTLGAFTYTPANSSFGWSAQPVSASDTAATTMQAVMWFILYPPFSACGTSP